MDRSLTPRTRHQPPRQPDPDACPGASALGRTRRCASVSASRRRPRRTTSQSPRTRGASASARRSMASPARRGACGARPRLPPTPKLALRRLRPTVGATQRLVASGPPEVPSHPVCSSVLAMLDSAAQSSHSCRLTSIGVDRRLCPTSVEDAQAVAAVTPQRSIVCQIKYLQAIAGSRAVGLSRRPSFGWRDNVERATPAADCSQKFKDPCIQRRR